MNSSIKKELLAHVLDLVKDGTINRENSEDWQEIGFNQDYYIIGYYQAEQWLEKHGVSAWAAIEYVAECQMDLCGKVTWDVLDMNAETIVNMLVYFVGDELLQEHEQEIVEAVIQARKN